jgi:hypothetical protein
MPEWIGDWFDKLVSLFGPVGAFAIVLLGLALWALKNRQAKIDELQEQLTQSAEAHALAIAAKEAECVAEKAEHRNAIEQQLRKEIDIFMVRDEQKRNDVVKCFEKLDVFIERVVDAMAAVEKTLTDLRIQLARSGG